MGAKGEQIALETGKPKKGPQEGARRRESPTAGAAGCPAFRQKSRRAFTAEVAKDNKARLPFSGEGGSGEGQRTTKREGGSGSGGSGGDQARRSRRRAARASGRLKNRAGDEIRSRRHRPRSLTVEFPPIVVATSRAGSSPGSGR